MVHQLNTSHSTRKQKPQLQAVLDKYAIGFTDSHQAVKTDAAKIYVDNEAIPKYYKSRPLPYVMRDMMDKEIDRLLAEDIIEPVQYSDWAAPVVPVMKADKSVRLCGDYKLTEPSSQTGQISYSPNRGFVCTAWERYHVHEARHASRV